MPPGPEFFPALDAIGTHLPNLQMPTSRQTFETLTVHEMPPEFADVRIVSVDDATRKHVLWIRYRHYCSGEESV